MAPLRVHIAELVIATDPATADVSIADSISERAEAKGLVVVGREIVADVEEQIRAKLEAFIGDPDVDVVIATGVAESTAAANALRPLVTQPVPGFTDLFRWLAYQEIGASAMLSNAEAAQCSSTFVFLLPAVKGAVIEAMNKLILPQLDPATTPKNLVQQIPRLAPLVELARAAAPRAAETKPEAVPHRIEAERTESGPGISARAPAVRPASKTGPHVIRKEPPPDVTRQIDRSELERTIRKSESNDAVTKPAIDIRTLLPKVPPGADEDTDEVGDDTDITGAAPPQPLARVKLVQPVRARKPPTIQIPALPKPAAKPAEEITNELPPVAKPAETAADKPADKRPVKPTEKPKDRVPPALQKKTPPAGAVVSLADLARSADDLDTGQVLKLPPKAVQPATRPTPTPTPAPRATPTRPTPTPTPAPARPARIPTSDIAELDAELVSEELPTTRAPAIKPAEAEPAAPADDDEVATIHAKKAAPEPAAEPAEPPVVLEKRARPKTEPPPPPVKKRAPTEPPVLKVPDKKQPAERTARTPTEPPPPRDSLNDLPRGKFVYPERTGSTGKTIAKWTVAALLAAAAGVAFVHFFLAKPEHPKVAVADAGGARVVEAPVDAAAVAEAEPDAAIPEIEIDVSDGSGTAGSASGSGRGSATAPKHPTHPTGGTHVTAVTHDGSGGSGAGSSAGSAVATGPAVPPEDPSCDEVSCVLEKYARPCCARYKPADSGFKPAFPGQTESLDKVAVKEGIEGVKPRVISCGEKFSAKGTVKIAMTVGPDGTVKDASVADSPTPELGTCVAQALRAATFLKTAKGGSFVYPFVF